MLKKLFSALFALAFVAAAAAETAPDAFVKGISTDVIESAKADKAVQAGDINRIQQLVDQKVMPSVAFEVVTRSAVGPKWREATPEQRQKLQDEFKKLLVRVYAGALSQVKDQTVEITKTQPVQGSQQVVVQSEVRGKGEPIRLDYRLDKVADAWKIIDVNVGGIWLVTSYRSQFAPYPTADALLAKLVEMNKGGAKS